MSTFNIKFQTADSVPAPFAHAIEINGKFLASGEVEIDFDLSYLSREDLTEEEILEEGFSTNDDYKWQGTLPKVWGNLLLGNLKTSPVLKIDSITEFQDYWQLEQENKVFFPKNHEQWKFLVEEIQQAILEFEKIEAPLLLNIIRINSEEKYKLGITASFYERALTLERTELENNKSAKKKLNWEELNFILKNIYSGEFLEEKAIKSPSKNGLFVNLGDEFWFEVGKGLLVSPSNITKVLGLW